MVVLNRPEKAREFLLEVTELDRCQLALFAALRRIVLKQLGHAFWGFFGSKPRTMTLSPQEFLRRFLQHVLPRGFPRIRYFGWLANRTRKHLLPLCRLLLHQSPPATQASSLHQPSTWRCPLCQGPMSVLERLTAAQILFAETRLACSYDSS